MSGYVQPWWVAGGWAIDAFIGAPSREHGDIDIAVLRRDQRVLRNYLRDWQLRKVVDGSIQLWGEEEVLELPIHEIHANSGDAQLEFLLNEAEGDRWVYRRNNAISMPLPRLTVRSAWGVPSLCPEVVLLYKAKQPTQRDHDDFARVLPILDAQARKWLASALIACHPGHEWHTAVVQ